MSLKDDLLKHKIFIQRLTKNHAKILMPHVKKAVKIGKIAIDKTPNIGYNQLKQKLGHELHAGTAASIAALLLISKYEVKFLTKTLQKYGYKVPEGVDATKRIYGGVVSTGLQSKSKKLTTTYDAFVDSQSRSIADVVTNQNKELDKSRALDLLLAGLLTHQLLSLTNTTINYTAAETHLEVFKQTGLDETLVWLSELDNSVCDYCEDLHGEVFTADSLPDWPAHANCRCDVMPDL